MLVAEPSVYNCLLLVSCNQQKLIGQKIKMELLCFFKCVHVTDQVQDSPDC